MASQEDVAHQQSLLAIHRRNLAYYIRQQAQLGPAQAPIGTLNGIEDTARCFPPVSMTVSRIDSASHPEVILVSGRLDEKRAEARPLFHPSDRSIPPRPKAATRSHPANAVYSPRLARI